MVSLTNVSGAPIPIPESLAEGLAIFQKHKPYPRKDSEPAEAYIEEPPLLSPSETRVYSKMLDARAFYRWNPAQFKPNQPSPIPFGTLADLTTLDVDYPYEELPCDIRFSWEGFLEPNDRSRLSRFNCEKRILVTRHVSSTLKPAGVGGDALPVGGAEMDRAVYDPTAEIVKPQYRYDQRHGRAVKHRLDAVGADELGGDRFVAVVFENDGIPGLRHALVAAWFRYDPSKDQEAEVNYFLMPMSSSYRASWLNNHTGTARVCWIERGESSEALEKMYEGKQPLESRRIKQVTIPLPPGLRDDALVEGMRRLHLVAVHEKEAPVTWGVKSAGMELIRNVYSHGGNPGLLARIQDEFIWPIAKAVLERETPKQWKKDYQMHKAGKLGKPVQRLQHPYYDRFAEQERRRGEVANLPK